MSACRVTACQGIFFEAMMSALIEAISASLAKFSSEIRSKIRFLDMRSTCEHAYSMSKMVQIRNVPDALHRKLKARAAVSGRTLSDYLLAEIERLAARPTREEMLERIHRRSRVALRTPAAAVIGGERESV